MIHLILGGARSGKSSYAERLVIEQYHSLQRVYVATATAFDHGMARRIAKHQQQRTGDNWQLIECPVALVECLEALNDHQVCLVECLSLWLNNLLYQQSQQECTVEQLDEYLHQQTKQLVEQLAKSQVNVVMVSNEVGFGVMPMGEQTRLFVDHLGWLNQKIAQVADQVDLLCAGIAMPLKRPS
ncbi:bifunctional adenosylcobinamide kinase/adenosylcobinamide-phosphate guanylyltransferase [Thalassotalea ganghwensis]